MPFKKIGNFEFGGPHAETMCLDMGPTHPLTQGNLRLLLKLNGEDIVGMDTEIGYQHRGVEKLCEGMTWEQIFPLCERLNYMSPLINSFGYAMTVEKLLGVKVPERCEYIRTLMSELSRMSDHLSCIGKGALGLGNAEALQHAHRGRERIWDLIGAVSGQRILPNYARIGGLQRDLPSDINARWSVLREQLLKVFSGLERCFLESPLFIERAQGVGILSQEDAIHQGFTGPTLRSTGVEHDVRKSSPYHAYAALDFEVVVGSVGDNYDRYLVRMEELRQSLKIADQCLSGMPQGPICCDDPRISLFKDGQMKDDPEALDRYTKQQLEGLEMPAGEVYGYVEGSNGELGFYIVSKGGGRPWRMRVRPPSLYALGGMHAMMGGAALGDVLPIFETLNVVSGELDR